jgi:two-component system, NarL family, response regulator NreC
MSTRILIADDHRIVREGLRSLLEDQTGITVVGEAEDGRKAVELASRLRPDIVIMDLTMPGLNGIEATRQITASHSDMKVIALSIHTDRRFVRQMFEAGASGYVLKEGAFEELARAIRAVASGQAFVSPGITEILIEDCVRLKSSKSASAGTPALSSREREVLQLLAEGKSTKEIATVLRVATKTVETHRRQVMLKLQLNSVAELTKYAIREGLTSL